MQIKINDRYRPVLEAVKAERGVTFAFICEKGIEQYIREQYPDFEKLLEEADNEEN